MKKLPDFLNQKGFDKRIDSLTGDEFYQINDISGFYIIKTMNNIFEARFNFSNNDNYYRAIFHPTIKEIEMLIHLYGVSIA